MTGKRREAPEPSLLHILQPDEEVHVLAQAIDGTLAVTDHRLVVTDNGRVALDVAHGELRRIQFDIERNRPATLVIVPDSPSHPPEVLSIPTSAYEEAARALVIVGQELSREPRRRKRT